MYTNMESDSDDDNPLRFALPENSPQEAVLLLNRQRAVRANWEEIRQFLYQLYSSLAGSPFSVRLVSDRAIRKYNKQYRQKDQSTDVLSFPSGGGEKPEYLPEYPSQYLGDILISVESARENAARYRIKLPQEIKLLALHGVLHLMGYDHETDRGQMARAERRWCAKLGLPASLTTRSRRPRLRKVVRGRR
jgi:probable rRNA maturation factor